MYYNAMWAADMWSPISTEETLRYFKIANRIKQAMERIPAENMFKIV